MTKAFPNSAVVVAHPDDEALWFSSVLEEADEVIMCYLDLVDMPELGAGRRAVLENFPLKGVSSLEVEEAGSFDTGDWTTPSPTPFGLRIDGHAGIREHYEGNFRVLVDRLRDKLRGCENVITHNPWGEYGHEDHVQVYRAVKSLQEELGFRLWYSSYCGNRSSKLMFDHLRNTGLEYLSLPTNVALAHEIADLYKEHGCWTWDDDFIWFKRESFLTEVEVGHGAHGCPVSFPTNMLYTTFEGPHRASLRTRVLRVLRRGLRRIGGSGRGESR